MRILLATAVAIAPLMIASGAVAEVVISSNRTTPITTLNATGSGPDDIRIASGGAITLTSGVAVTVNSSHSLDTDAGGRIDMAASANGSTAILVQGGNTADITLGGAITVLDDITTETDLDTDDDGDNDGAFARGTDRYGVRVTGAAPLVGDILLESGGTIVVSGNNSYGLSLEAPLTGDLTTIGTIAIRGDGSYGVRTTGDVSGDIRLIGAINAQGAGAVGASIEGDVGGTLLVQSNLTATGFRYTTRPAARPDGLVDNADNKGFLFLDDLDADDLLVGGPALHVGSNVAGGVLLGRALTYSAAGIEGDDDNDGVKNGDEDDDGDGLINRSDADRDGNGVVDASESTAAVTTYGSAPAILVGSATQDVALGAVGTGDSAYGFINRGSVSALGVYDGFAANGLVFDGGAGHAVDIAGGIRNEGTIVSLSFDANSTAIRLGAGATAPTLQNSGTITAASSSAVAAEVAAVRIDAGASLPSFTNSGSILATSGGGVANTTAILDLSGTLTSITNLRSLQATLNANADGDPVTGQTTAINVAANTTGVTILQNGVASTPTVNDPDTDGDGVTNGNEPIIAGDIRLGSGADTVDIRNGRVLGDVYFGAGADQLAITGGAEVRGGIFDSDGALDINVSNGVLEARQTTATNISELSVGAAGDLIVTLDGANGTSGGFNVAGTATLADGAGL
ncbi:MAG: beta strand repeat-containing protein, partial [Brevundimonas sp.]